MLRFDHSRYVKWSSHFAKWTQGTVRRNAKPP